MRALACIVIAACMTAPAPSPQIGPQIGTTHVSQTRNIQPPELAMPPPRPVPPEAAQELLTAVDEVDAAGPDQMRVVRALRAFADALDVVAPGRPNDLIDMRQAIDQLEGSAPRTGSDAQLVQLALNAAARALAAVPPSKAVDLNRLQSDVGELGRMTASLALYRPLREQRAELRMALRASVRAVFAATGAPPPVLAQIRSPSG